MVFSHSNSVNSEKFRQNSINLLSLQQKNQVVTPVYKLLWGSALENPWGPEIHVTMWLFIYLLSHSPLKGRKHSIQQSLVASQVRALMLEASQNSDGKLDCQKCQVPSTFPFNAWQVFWDAGATQLQIYLAALQIKQFLWHSCLPVINYNASLCLPSLFCLR